MSEQLAAEFSDSNGKAWRLAFSIGLIRRLKDEAGFDVGNLQDGKSLMELSFDMLRFGQVVWILCEKQADAAGVEETEFAESLGGDCLDSVFVALTEAIINFTRTPMRGAVTKIIEAANQATATSGDSVVTAIETNAEKINQLIKSETTKAMQKSLSGSLLQS